MTPDHQSRASLIYQRPPEVDTDVKADRRFQEHFYRSNDKLYIFAFLT